MTIRSDSRSGLLARLGKAVDWWLGGSVLGPLRTYGAATIITAGPWIVSILALAIVSISMQPVLGLAAIEDLRLTVVYAFALAPLLAGPVGIAAARLGRKALDEGREGDVGRIFLAACLISAAATQVLAVGICFALGIGPEGTAIGFVFLAVIAALLWTSFAMLGALRAYGFLIVSFSLGMALSVGCMLVVARWGPSVERLIWSFNIGFVLCVVLTAARLGALRDHLPGLGETFRGLGQEISQQRHLCLAVLLAIAGLWVDKWVLWFGPSGLVSSAGFRHSITYDGVMFVAHLSIIPTFAAILVFHDGELARAIGGFRHALENRSTYGELQRVLRRLNATIWNGLLAIVFVQAALTGGLLLLTPMIALRMDFSFSQYLMLQVGLVAVFLHAIFYLTCSTLILCGRTRHFLWVQGVFFGLNLGASLVFYAILGISAYAIFLASLVAAVVGFAFAYRETHRYDYCVFVGENHQLYGRGGSR